LTPARHDAPEAPRCAELSAADLDRLAGALFLLATGFLSALLLFLQAFQLPLFVQQRWPSYWIGMLLALVGSRRLRRTAGGRFRSLAGRMAIASALCIYLAPFAGWWKQAPYADTLFAHAALIPLLALLLLLLFARLAARVGELAGDAPLVLESRISGTGIVLLLILPLLGSLLLSAWRGIRYGGSIYSEWLNLAVAVPRPVLLGALFPVTMILACLWKARSLCRSALVARAEARDDAEGPGAPGGSA
jgi:hypothetical protein